MCTSAGTARRKSVTVAVSAPQVGSEAIDNAKQLAIDKTLALMTVLPKETKARDADDGDAHH
jgi:hypothetical protein